MNWIMMQISSREDGMWTLHLADERHGEMHIKYSSKCVFIFVRTIKIRNLDCIRNI